MRIVLLGGVIGEDGKDWHKGEAKEASTRFARELIARALATEAPEEKEEKEAPAKSGARGKR